MGAAQGFVEGRSIPACAGEPLCEVLLHLLGRVYPRVCGGTTRPASRGLHSRGLSPRVRGNLRQDGRAGRRPRSIPACAGEPRNTDRTASRTAVYPRVCGGTGHHPRPLRDGLGLSPRVRGNPIPRTPTCWRRWSIPACAGEPLGEFLAGNDGRVYPRVCGGTGQNHVV